MIIACDHCDQSIFIGYGQTPQAIQVRPCSSIDDAVALLQSTEKDAEKILLTEQFPPLEDFLKDVTKIARLPRLEAVYWFYKENLARSDCLVTSIGLTSCSGAVIKDGRLVEERKADPSLALRKIWEEHVYTNQPLKEAVDVYLAAGHPDAEEQIFKGFREALRGKVVQNPIPFYPHVSLNRAIKPLKAFLGGLDPQGVIKRLILTDWAALGNLPELMRKEGYIVYTSDDSAFYDSVRGLVVWGFKQEVHQERQNVETSQDRPDETHGPGDQAEPGQNLVECVHCGKKNRVSSQPSKRRPMCGACKKPLPPILFDQAKEALRAGEYSKAIKCLHDLSEEDKSNKLYQALQLSATIKHYKSIQGYEKKVGEVREWTDLGETEKPWVKEILTLAGKEYLEKGDIEPAEENLEAAYQIEPSGEGSLLLAEVKKEKGDRALRKGDFREAQSFYQEAAIKDPADQDYPRYLTQVTKLIQSKRGKKQKLAWAFLGVAAISWILGAWFWRDGPSANGDPGGEIRTLQAQIAELKEKNDKLERELEAQQAQSPATDRQTPEVPEPAVEPPRQGDRKDEELDRARRVASIEREARVRAEGELAQSRLLTASLQEKVAKAEEELRARDEAARRLRPGRYRVIRDADLLNAADKNATVVSRIERGVNVRVVEIVDGTWLRVISTMGNDPGYLHRDDAVLLSPESTRP